MQAFLFYVDDWISSKHIELMDAAEERGYLRLLLRCAKEEDCGISCDDAQLSIMSMLGPQWWKPTADKARRIANKTSGDKLRECFEVRGDRMYNLRLLKEFENQKRIREERRMAGLKGGRPKANEKQLVSNSLANEKQLGKQTESKTKQAQALSPALPEGKEKHTSASAADRASRGTRLSLTEPTAEMVQFAKTLGWPDSHISRQWHDFSDFWSNKPGQKGIMLDWLKTWRTWCRKEWNQPSHDYTIPASGELWPGHANGTPHPGLVGKNPLMPWL